MDETLHDPGTDAQAVAAVRRGDAERYRELVERHERRVFAVAWSRLGDAALAEEATQEAFIRGYRRLWLLGDDHKFAGWITSIARNIAINLGLRHRRELKKRERWALENPAASSGDNAATETDPHRTPESLCQTLAELSPAHRECLALFYLEGKSGAEAAAALGISESALRVRLHRARSALRERLEEKLAGSLAKLRPAQTLVPAIMAGVFASSSAKAATAGGVGATVVGALTKFAPFKWAFVFFPFLFALPMLLVSWLLVRAELANFRDKEGFRVRMFRAGNFQRLLWMLLMVVLVFLFTRGGKNMTDMFFLAVTLVAVLALSLAWRQIVINHSRFFVVTMISSGVFCVVMLFVALHWLPFTAFHIFLALNVIATSLVHGERPIRMDYNLFLRAAERMLDLSPEAGRPVKETKRFSKAQLFAFGRFIGSRWMADNYRWTADGLLLRMPPFNFSMWNAISFFGSWSRRSQLLLTWDGKVAARLGAPDHKALLKLPPNHPPDTEELETKVSAAVEIAWGKFGAGDLSRAERVLGQLPEYEVFLQSPTKAGLLKWRTIMLVIVLGAMFVLIGLTSFKPPWIDGKKPVSITEAQVRTFLSGGVTTNPNPIINNRQQGYLGAPTTALDFCLVLPPKDLFSQSSIQAMQHELFRACGININTHKLDRLRSFEHAWLLHKSMAGGWLSWADVGLEPQEATAHFQKLKPNDWQFRMPKRKAWSWVDNQGWDVERMGDFTLNQLRWLRGVNCLDLVDREKLIQQIASVQTLSGNPPGNPPIHDWRNVRGLFFTPGWPALHDTYFALSALEILEGLDKIDREACTRGILKHHSGKGHFTSPSPGGYNEYKIAGDGRDTFCAFESLRILGALDRVKDLEKWQFRVKSNRASKPDANGVRTPTWEEIEAWVCQERLARIIRERKENPNGPTRSLLEP